MCSLDCVLAYLRRVPVWLAARRELGGGEVRCRHALRSDLLPPLLRLRLRRLLLLLLRRRRRRTARSAPR